jgi:hypothetical protein
VVACRQHRRADEVDQRVRAGGARRVVGHGDGRAVGPGVQLLVDHARAAQEAGQGDDHAHGVDQQRPAGRTYVVGNTPRLRQASSTCLTDGHPDLGDCLFTPRADGQREAEASFAAAEAAGARSIDASRWFCFDGVCPSVVGDLVTMRDLQHMTVDYSRRLAEPLAAALGLQESAGGP